MTALDVSAKRAGHDPSVPFSAVLTTVPAVVVAALIVAARGCTLIGLNSLAAISIVAIAIVAATTAIWIGRHRAARPAVRRPEVGELAALGLAAVAAFLIAGRTLRYAFFSPTTYTIDAAHHGALVSWIVDNQSLPIGYSTTLSTLSGYPPWAHVIPALLSKLTGLAPITSMWLFAILAVVGQWPLVGIIARAAVAAPGWSATVVSTLLLIIGWRFTIGIVTWDFFFAQVVSLWLGVAGVAIVATATEANIALRRWALPVGVLAAAALFTYPQQGAIVPAAVACALLVRKPDRSPSPRVLAATAVGVLLGFAAVIVFLQRSNYLNAELLLGLGEGAVTLPSMSTLGGWIPTALAIVAVPILFSLAIRRRPAAGALLGAAGAPVLLALGLWAAQRGWLIQLDVTTYRIAKNVYAAVPFGAAAAAVAVSWTVGSVQRRHVVVGVVASAAVLAVASRPTALSGVSTPIASRDAYELGTWARHHLPVESVGVAGLGLEPYTLWWSALLRPAPPLGAEAAASGAVMAYINGPGADGLSPRSMRWAQWPSVATTEQYLLVSGDALVRMYVARPGVAVVRRRGTAALLERTAVVAATPEPGGADSGTPEQGVDGLP